MVWENETVNQTLRILTEPYSIATTQYVDPALQEFLGLFALWAFMLHMAERRPVNFVYVLISITVSLAVFVWSLIVSGFISVVLVRVFGMVAFATASYHTFLLVKEIINRRRAYGGIFWGF